MRFRVAAWFAFLVVACVVPPSLHADWPGILGPQRDGHARPSERLTGSADAKPKIRWQVAAGEGFAGAAVSAGRVCLFDREDASDRVRCIELSTGKELWVKTLPASYRGSINPDSGPRCVPTIVNDRVLLATAAGDLYCLRWATGDKIWHRPLRKEFGAEDGYFGAGSTPWVGKDRIVVNVGAKKAGIVCLSLEDGSTLWTATGADASYASPIGITVEGAETVVVPTRLVTYGLDVETGRVQWEFPFGQRGPTVNAAMPIRVDDSRYLLTASYGIGTVLFEPARSRVQVQKKGELLSSQYATPLFANGFVFGSDGREDMGGSTYRCIDPRQDQPLWEQEGVPICHTLGVDQKLLVCGIDGRIWCLEPSEQKFSPKWTARLPDGVYRALPAFSDGRLIVKSDQSWFAVEFTDR